MRFRNRNFQMKKNIMSMNTCVWTLLIVRVPAFRWVMIRIASPAGAPTGKVSVTVAVSVCRTRTCSLKANGNGCRPISLITNGSGTMAQVALVTNLPIGGIDCRMLRIIRRVIRLQETGATRVQNLIVVLARTNSIMCFPGGKR